MTEPLRPTIKQNKIAADPTLKDLLDLFKRDIFLSLNCHAVGTIQEFDSSAQTAKVSINYKKTIFTTDVHTNAYRPVDLDYPILVDCPVMVLKGGAASLTFPISSGDSCLVFFNDRDIDNWFNSGQVSAVSSPRLHSFSDAIVLVGLSSKPQSLDDYDETRAVLQHGTTFVGVGANKVKIANILTTLNTVLQSLIVTLQSITTTNCVVGSPVVLNAATISALSARAAEIAGLLE